MMCGSVSMKCLSSVKEVTMNAIFVKIALIFRTILAALGMGGCLNPKDVDIIDEVVEDLIHIEQVVEEIIEK